VVDRPFIGGIGILFVRLHGDEDGLVAHQAAEHHLALRQHALGASAGRRRAAELRDDRAELDRVAPMILSELLQLLFEPQVVDARDRRVVSRDRVVVEAREVAQQIEEVASVPTIVTIPVPPRP
jgi:hypothetical protein